MKKLLKRFVFYLLAILILLYLLMLIVTALMTFAEYKLDITSYVVLENILQTAKNPLHYGMTSVKEKNPLIIIGSLSIIVYTLFLFIKGSTKNKAWEADKNDTHGSAKWKNKKDFLHDGNYRSMNYKTFYDEWKESIK